MSQQLAAEEREVLQFVFDKYLEDGEWPKGWQVERTFVEQFDGFGPLELLPKKFPGRIYIEYDDHEVRLPPELIFECKGGRALLQIVVDLVPIMWEIFKKSAEQRPRITNKDLEALGWEPIKIHRAFLALRTSYHLTGSSGWNHDRTEWHFEISRNIVQFRRWQRPEDFVEFVLETERPRADARRGEETDRLEHTQRTVEPNTAFILMSMDRNNPDLEDVLNAVKDTCARFGIDALRADEVQHQDVITDVIIDRIRRSEIIVADLSFERPSVYYEIGYAHALDIRPILMRREGTKIHFDLAAFNVPEYRNVSHLKELLAQRLEAVTNKKALDLVAA